MTTPAKSTVILMADDDADDRLLAKDALAECRLANELHFVENGEELLDYLQRRGKYEQLVPAPRPSLILLDLNMPKMDGREALKAIKGDKALHDIPIVVLSTSSLDQDIVRSYQLGVNSFITKPVTFPGLVDAMNVLGRYWLEIVELPPAPQ